MLSFSNYTPGNKGLCCCCFGVGEGAEHEEGYTGITMCICPSAYLSSFVKKILSDLLNLLYIQSGCGDASL